MEAVDENVGKFQKEDHEGAYIFKPATADTQASARPSKRRRTSREVAYPSKDAASSQESSLFVPLLSGTEAPECVGLREKIFESSWAAVESRIQDILRDANSATLDEVTTFVQDETSPEDKLPAAFIITGANIASQDMLFEQLSERLQASTKSKFVRLRSSDAPNIKATLKKIIQDATSRGGLDEEDVELSFGQDGRKYLNYDLEGLHAFVQAQSSDHVFVAFEDSEGFDSALLSDLIVLFHSWVPRIPFTLLFGVATSVELLQARLLKSACHLVYGAQFDVVQTKTILEQVFAPAVAGKEVALRLGAGLLQAFVDRQHDQVAGIQMFVSSLKYAYMCHFYGNPLSVFMVADDTMNSELVQSEHLEAFRQLPSFRRMVEDAVNDGRLEFAKSAIQDDEFLTEMIFDIPKQRQEWVGQTLRALSLLKATGVVQESFSQMYLRALSNGVSLEPDGFDVLPAIKRQQPEELFDMLQRLVDIISSDSDGLWLSSQSRDASEAYISNILELTGQANDLIKAADGKGNALRSAYSGQSRILRTTVVAQKVQLSRDSAALSEEDKEFTLVVDRAVALLQDMVRSEPATGVALHEAWLYDARSPHREVLVPRPRQVFERSLLRPYDYLACSCCGADSAGGIATTLPVTSLLYHLYLEAGSIINVADLWAAFFAMVGREEGGEEEGGHDERTALVLFYKGLAELKALGFVKASRKKTDHIAKLKWL